MLLNCCTQYANKLENSAVATEVEKVRDKSNSEALAYLAWEFEKVRANPLTPIQKLCILLSPCFNPDL